MKRKTTLRRVLDQIDAVLVKDDTTAQMLWDILTALRGPDDYALSDKLKQTGTNHVRREAFPKTATSADNGHYGFANGADFRVDKLAIPNQYNSGGHAQSHIGRGLRALGLDK